MLRDEDFVTEVHHINGEGRDGGVVYSEMEVGPLVTTGKILNACRIGKQLVTVAGTI